MPQLRLADLKAALDELTEAVDDIRDRLDILEEQAELDEQPIEYDHFEDDDPERRSVEAGRMDYYGIYYYGSLD